MNMNQKKYTHKIKLSTLRLLEKNDFNYLRTEKLTGVSRSTLKKWEAQFGAEVFSNKSPKEIALIEVGIEMKRNDEVIIRKYYTLRNQILDRIIELVPNTTKLDPLVSTLKSISEELTLFDELNKNSPSKARPNLLETIMKNLDMGKIPENTSTYRRDK
jgi:hypothetical protein